MDKNQNVVNLYDCQSGGTITSYPITYLEYWYTCYYSQERAKDKVKKRLKSLKRFKWTDLIIKNRSTAVFSE